MTRSFLAHLAGVVCVLLFAVTAPAAETVDSAYPGLATGALRYARPEKLPEGVLLKAGDVQIGAADLEKLTADAPEQFRDELKKYAFFVLETHATGRLLGVVAKNELGKAGVKTEGKAEREIVSAYIDRLVEKVAVTDQEVERFYTRNSHLFGGAKLDQVKDSVRVYLLDNKKEAAVEEHLRGLGTRLSIALDADWVKKQAAASRDNPVDKARWSGKPTLVAFSAASCCGPDTVLPLLETVREDYGEKLGVVHVEAQKEQILAGRYGVRSIPTLIFYSKDGLEKSREVGGVSADSLKKTLAEIGVK